MGASIKNISYVLPKNQITNDDLKKEFPSWDADKMTNKIGISSRFFTDKDETALDLAYKASIEVLSQFDKNKIDFVILCTQSPDYILPTSACILQDRLSLRKNIGAFDFNLGCSGFVYGLSLCKGLIAGGIASNILLVMAETYSKHIYKKDVTNRAIFGDAASATIVLKSEDDKIQKFCLGTDGSGYGNLIVKTGGVKYHNETNAEELGYGDDNLYTCNNLYMNGPDIFTFTIENIPTLINDTLYANELSMDEVDYFIFHQPNRFMLDFLRKKIKIPKEKFYNNIQEIGNTVSNTIPIALKESLDNKIIKKRDKVLLVGFGVGYSWGATIIEI